MVATGRRDAIACSTAARGGAILQILIFEQGTFERELMPEAFLSLIVTMLPAFRNVEQRLDRETGRRFNVFDNLFPMDERATSQILEFLLDPTEAHGQNDVFLREFIRQFIPEWQRTFKFPKAHKGSTRELIDVVISDGTHWLGIENKIFGAPEQERQAGRYLDALHDDAPHREDYRLVYLSPSGNGTSEYSLPSKDRDRHGANLVCAAWVQTPVDDAPEDDARVTTPPASILEWLGECRKICSAENVAWLVRQFSSHVESVVAGRKEADMVDTAIIGLALKDENHLEAALRVGENFIEIRRSVVTAFLGCILVHLEEWVQKHGEDWEVRVKWRVGNWIERPMDKYLPLLLRKRSWPAMVGVGIQAEWTGPSEV